MRTFNTIEAAVEFSLRFFDILRSQKIQISFLQSVACVRSIGRLQAMKASDLRTIFRITLINQPDALTRLSALFDNFLDWYFSPEKHSKFKEDSLESKLVGVQYQGNSDVFGEQDSEDKQTNIQSYSTVKIDRHKDFRLFPKQQSSAIISIFEDLAKKNKELSYRKWKSSGKGRQIDLRSSIRECVRYDGDVAKWSYKNKVPNFTRLTVVVDVSGSMEIYSIFLLNFLHELARHRRFKIDIFVFSTELKCLTNIFRLKNFQEMLEKISSGFSGWSGGTKIGRAIATLNRDHVSSIKSDTLVTIMSDGWDTGEPDLLKSEMRKLSRKAKSLVWINPLKGDPTYEPLAAGMAVARPFCDEFISGHSIASLEKYGKMIS